MRLVLRCGCLLGLLSSSVAAAGSGAVSSAGAEPTDDALTRAYAQLTHGRDQAAGVARQLDESGGTFLRIVVGGEEYTAGKNVSRNIWVHPASAPDVGHFFVHGSGGPEQRHSQVPMAADPGAPVYMLEPDGIMSRTVVPAQGPATTTYHVRRSGRWTRVAPPPRR